MSLERRISRLEQAQERTQSWRHYQMVAAEFGFDAAELMDEAEAFFALPLVEQLAEVDRIAAESLTQGIPWDEVEAIKATLVREYRP
jgi:hypothetical protein